MENILVLCAMNYFELYELPQSLHVNKSYNLKKFYELSRIHHPDHFTLASAQAQDEALQRSTEINAAKKVLDQPYLRLEYVLKINGRLATEEKYTLAPIFLMEMMELNEQIMEQRLSEDEAGKQQTLQTMQQLEEELYAPVQYFFQQEQLQPSEEEFALLKDYYFKMKYLYRLREQLDGKQGMD